MIIVQRSPVLKSMKQQQMRKAAGSFQLLQWKLQKLFQWKRDEGKKLLQWKLEEGKRLDRIIAIIAPGIRLNLNNF